MIDDDAEPGVPGQQRLARGDHDTRTGRVNLRAAPRREVDARMEVGIVGAAVGVGRLEREAGRAPLLGDLRRALRPSETVAGRAPGRASSAARRRASSSARRRASAIAADWAAACCWSWEASVAAASAARWLRAIIASTSSSAARLQFSAAAWAARFCSAATRSWASWTSRAASSSRRALRAASSSRATARAWASAMRPSRRVARRVSSSARIARISSARTVSCSETVIRYPTWVVA